MIVHKNYYQDPRVRRYVESLVKTGALVDVICPPQDPNFDVVFQVQDQIRVHVIPIRHAGGNKVGYALEYLFSFIWYSLRLSILCFRNRYTIVHVHNMPDFLIFAAVIPKIKGTPLVLDIHDPMPEVFISKYGEQSNKLMQNLIKWQEKISCWLADEVITVNSTCKTNLINRGIPPEKITVVHNFPNSDIFDRERYLNECGAPRKYFTLIYPGTLAPRYGLETVVRALVQLKEKIPEIRLLIFCQSTPYKDELQRLANQLGVSSCIEFKRLVPHEEMPHELIKADIGIYPAVNDIHMSLATPTKVLEFSAMGIPIVSSRLKMVEELFGDSAIMFFESGNVSQFAERVMELYQNPTLCEELTANAYQIFVQNFSWEHEFQIYLEMLHRLLSGMIEIHSLNTTKGSE
jgi:glycosyltransferase involved in cell wall biosynthesis